MDLIAVRCAQRVYFNYNVTLKLQRVQFELSPLFIFGKQFLPLSKKKQKKNDDQCGRCM